MSEETTPAVIEVTEPKDIIRDPVKRDALYAQIKATIAGQTPDLTTDKGRKDVASLAYKIAKAKTAIDKAGTELTEASRKEISRISGERNAVVAELEKLQALARKPLDEWEKAAAERKVRREAVLTKLEGATRFRVGVTAAEMKARLAEIETVALDPADLEDATAMASSMKSDAIEKLTRSIAETEQAEKDAAELAELRRLQAERDRADRERAEKEAAEAAEAQREKDRLAKLESDRLLHEANQAREAAEAVAAEANRKLAEVKPELVEERASPPKPSVFTPLGNLTLRDDRVAGTLLHIPVTAQPTYVPPTPSVQLPSALRPGDLMSGSFGAPVNAAEMAEVAAVALQRESGLSPAASLRIVSLIRDGKIPHLTFG